MSPPALLSTTIAVAIEVDWWVSLIQAFVVINLVLVTFAYLTLAERKVMGRMQLRYGPNRAGPCSTAFKSSGPYATTGIPSS